MQCPQKRWPEGHGVYAIFNSVNGRRYYGRGCFDRRWPQHLYHLERGTHENSDLLADWRAYGADAFDFEIVVQLSGNYWRHSGRKEEEAAIMSDPNCYNRDMVGYRARQNGLYPIDNPYRNNGPLKSRKRKTSEHTTPQNDS